MERQYPSAAHVYTALVVCLALPQVNAPQQLGETEARSRAGVPPTLSKGSLRVTQVSPAIEAVVEGRGWGGQPFLGGHPPTGSWLLCAPISQLDGRLGASIQAPGPHPSPWQVQPQADSLWPLIPCKTPPEPTLPQPMVAFVPCLSLT